MEPVYERCCGLDVHKNMVVACLITLDAMGRPVKQVRTFATITADLLALGDWLRAPGCTHVAMEATGVYWKPIHNLLEDAFVLLVVNAQHIKAVPGRKTDVHDAEWIADLLRHGLLRGSFIPPSSQRELRELTRSRTTLVAERARVVNRLQKTLEDTNLQLASVATTILGQSARAMLEALLAGETDPAVRANLAQGRLRAKRQELQAALVGTLKSHHRFLLAEPLAHIDHLDEAMAPVDREIEAQMQADAAAVARLDTIPGMSQRAAEGILAEIGTDMSRFPSAKHLASWAGMCPGNYQSAGKQLHGPARKGSPWLRQLLLEAAHAAARTTTYLGAQYRRLAQRRGTKKPLFAVAHSILVITYHLLQRQVDYHDLGTNFFDERDREALQKRLVRRLEHLGYAVALQPSLPAA
jgi:transposase